jgi:NitT/TauT family transport system substrate-binding protein
VKVGVVRTATEAGLYLGIERGYFAEQGLQIELEDFNTAATEVPALGTNQIDVASGVLSAGLFNAIERGVGIKIVGPFSRQDASRSSNYILVRTDLIDSGAIRSFADLRGRSFAAPSRGGTVEYSVDVAMRQVGLTANDLHWINLDYPDQLAAFANQALDAGFAPEPIPTLAATRGVAVKWRSVGDWAPGMQIGVLLFAPAFEAANDMARRWMVAYLRGVRDYTDALQNGAGRQELFQVLARNTTMKDLGLYEEVGWANLGPDGNLNLASIRDQAQWYVDEGLVASPPDLGQIVDLQYVEYARSVLGRYPQ